MTQLIQHTEGCNVFHVVMLSVIIPCVVMLCVIIPCVVMLSVLVPKYDCSLMSPNDKYPSLLRKV